MPANMQLLIAEAQPSVRFALSFLLGSNGFNRTVILEANELEKTLREIDTPTNIIIGLPLLPHNPFALTSIARSNKFIHHIIIYTEHYTERVANKFLIAGATKVISKYNDLQDVISEITEALLDSNIEEIRDTIVSKKALGAISSLSQREYEVFTRLRQGEKYKDIGAALNLSVKTVGTYKTRISLKLGIDNLRDSPAD